jgi:hypothetical protein
MTDKGRAAMIPKFRYLVARAYVSNLQDTLDDYGNDGWRLVQVISDPDSTTEMFRAIFIREIVAEESTQ